ncbi:MAG: tRNA (guanosine(46)-N7)-methyltransferase TrmB [Provencibacterium sp.]|jgi:tRNA (guanine-N7-)-methyltransferase|nr:tRNA (guanosine(46)-N7)-methyltransferase TrmB [Provencibacterium sp.]
MRMRLKKWAAPELREAAFVVDAPELCRGRWRGQFARPDQPLYLELGCGKGGFISQLAFAHPEQNFLAIDKIDNMLGLAKRAVERVYAQRPGGPDNVRLASFEAECIDRMLAPEDRVERLYINFCNPWPRPRHRKHRLTYTSQLLRYRSFLAPGAEFYFKTDDDGLFRDTLNHYLPEAGFLVEEVIGDLHAAQLPENIETEHERMFSAEGIPIKFLRARVGELPVSSLAEAEASAGGIPEIHA